MQRLWTFIDLGSPPVRSSFFAYAVTIIVSMTDAAATAALFAWAGICLPFLLGMGATIVSASVGRGLHTLLSGAAMIASGVIVAPSGTDITRPIHVYFLIFFVLILAFASETIASLGARAGLQSWRLSQREGHLQSIFHFLPAPMLVFHRAGDILAINIAACRLFEIDADDARSTRIEALLESGDGGDAVARIAAAIALTRHSGQLATGWTRSGARLQLVLAMARVEMQSVDLWTLYLRDETAARAASARMAEIDAEVAQIGRAAALGAMGSSIAHELNQPLAAAANYANAAAATIKRLPYAHAIGPTVAAIDCAIEQILCASDIVKSLRTFVEYAPTVGAWTDLAMIVGETVRRSHFVIADKRARLIVDMPRNLGQVFVDRVQIGQVLLNLLNNAAEAVEERADRNVRLGIAIVAPGIAEIGVSDSGPGVSAAMMPTLFTPFKTSKVAGLGIGLAISRKIVEAHDSVLRYEVAPGGGAQFLFVLLYRDHEGE